MTLRRLLALACTALPLFAFAQQQPDAGRTLREQQPAVPALPERRAPEIRIDEPVRPSLKPSATLRVTPRAWRFSGNAAFASPVLEALVADRLGRESDFEALQAAAERLTRHYRDNGYPVARAYLPAQDVTAGTIEIAVLEGRFGKVGVVNRSRLRDEVVRRHLDGLEGQPLTQAQLERRMLLLNDLAGSGEARSAIRAGTRPGESDLDVALAESPWATGSLEFDNHGNRFTGQNRVTGEARLLSLLGLGDRLEARLTRGFDGLVYGRAAYQLPLGGDGWRLGAALSRTDYRLGRNFAALDASGGAESAQASLSYPLVRSVALNVYAQAVAERRTLEDRVNSTATVTNKRVDSAAFGLSGDTTLAGDVTAFSLPLTGGRLDIASPVARATDDVTARSQGGYQRLNYTLLRLQPVKERTSLFLSLSGQAASKNLDSSEKFSLGGAYGVRGYPAGEATGDAGHVATAELRHAIPVSIGVVQPFVFVDTGRVTINRNAFAAGANKRGLDSVGLGVTWLRAGDFQVKATWARRGKEAATSDTDAKSRAWIHLVKYF